MEASHSASTGSSHHEDSWTCHRCGWAYPNPHPSAKHRRNHKKQCGKIKGFELQSELHKGGSSDDVSSDDESHVKKDHLPPSSPQPLQAHHLVTSPATTGSPFPAVDHPIAFVEKEIFTDSAVTYDQQSREFSMMEDNTPDGVKAVSPNLPGFSDVHSRDFSMIKDNAPDGVKADSPNSQGSSDAKSGDPAQELSPSVAFLSEPLKTFLGGEEKVGHAASVDEPKVVTLDSPQLVDTDQTKESLKQESISNLKENVLTNQVDAGGVKIDQHDLWTCHDCGWTYPNAHPSAKHRRNHKKHCNKARSPSLGSVQVPPVGGGSSEEVSSDDESSHHESHAQKNLGSSATQLKIGTPIPKDVIASVFKESDGNHGQVREGHIESGPETRLGEGQDGLSSHTSEEASISVSALLSSDAASQASVKASHVFLPASVEEGQDGITGHTPEIASISSVSALLSSDTSPPPPASVTLDVFPAAFVKEKDVSTNKLNESSIVLPAMDLGKTGAGDETLDAATAVGITGHTPEIASISSVSALLSSDTSPPPPASVTLDVFPPAFVEEKDISTNKLNESSIVLPAMDLGKTGAGDETLDAATVVGPKDRVMAKEETDAAAGVFKLDTSSTLENPEALHDGTVDDPHGKANVDTLERVLGRGDGGFASHKVSSGSPPPTSLSDDTSAENESMKNILLLSTVSSTSEDAGLTKYGEEEKRLVGAQVCENPAEDALLSEVVANSKDDAFDREARPDETPTEIIIEGQQSHSIDCQGTLEEDSPQAVTSAGTEGKFDLVDEVDTSSGGPAHTFLSDLTSAENESVKKVLLPSTVSSASQDAGSTKYGEDEKRLVSAQVCENPTKLVSEDALLSEVVASKDDAFDREDRPDETPIETIIDGQPSHPIDCQETLEEDSPQAAISAGTEGKFDLVDEAENSKKAIDPADVTGESIEQSLHKPSNAMMENAPSKSDDLLQGAVLTSEVRSEETTCMEDTQQYSTPQDIGLFEMEKENDAGGIPSIKDAQQDNTAEATGSFTVMKESDAEEHTQLRNLCETRDGESLEMSSVDKKGITGPDTGFVQQAELRASARRRSDSLEIEVYEDAPDSLEVCSVGGSIEENEISDELHETLDGRQEEPNFLGATSLNKGLPDVITEPEEKPKFLDHSNARVVSEENTTHFLGNTYAGASGTQDLKAPSPEAWQELGTSDVGSESNEVQTEELIQAKNEKSSSSEVKEDDESGKLRTPLRSLLAKEEPEKTDQVMDTSNAKGPGDVKKMEGTWGSQNGTKPKARSIWSHCICCPAVH